MAEPVSLELAKAQCRVEPEDTEEDALLASYIAAARAYVEAETGLVLVRGSVVEHHPEFSSPLWLNAWPIVSIDSVAATDSDGEALTLGASDYRAVFGRRPGKLYPPRDGDWPAISAAEGVTVTMTAGYADGEVPVDLVQAMLLLIDHWHRNRSATVVGTISKEIEFAVSALCAAHRSMRTS